ncbi:hypothetical protein P0136_05835 [Lentisphaerota bacterium ZTH]|nr:hypothetical protein JYG24_03050 [Lentisphaerota bacterium]WET07511.1 hypothetical protein P0136_05835 [Lentisphaerota bacterium ZTH]
MEYSAAIDLSGCEAGFAVAETVSGNLICEATKPMSGRSSAGLPDWVLQLLAENNIDLKSIRHWTVGSGPGSFTGMRLAAAFVEGLIFSKEGIETRCVPTAFALGAELNTSDGDKIAALFDGRNKEILLYELENRNGEITATGVTEVLNKQQAADFFVANGFSAYTAFNSDRAALEKIISPEIISEIKFAEHIPTANLIKSSLPYTNNLTELVYIRPAVYAKKQA